MATPRRRREAVKASGSLYAVRPKPDTTYAAVARRSVRLQADPALFAEVNEAVLETRAEKRPGVPPQADLLALRERSRRVVDGDLERDIPGTHELGDQFPIEIEAVRFERQSVQAIAAEDLEHRERIPHPLPIDHIEQASKEQVSDVHRLTDEHLIGKVPHLPGLAVHAV